MMNCTRAFGHGEEPQQDRARGFQAAHHGGVLAGHSLGKELGAGAGELAGDIAQGFYRDRNAVERPAVFTPAYFRLCLTGGDKSPIVGHHCVAAQAIVVQLDACKHVAGQIDRGELAGTKFFSNLDQG